MLAQPGSLLGCSDELKPGTNTILSGKHIYSTVCGQVYKSSDGSVVGVKAAANAFVPRSGDVCVAKVVYMTSQLMEMQIVQIEDSFVEEQGIGGILRMRDRNQDQYSPGDYCLCKILTVSDKAYLLSTMEPGLGVIDVIRFQKYFRQ